MRHSESFTAIAAALALASGQFLPIKRDKTVTVTMKSGGQYQFKYAPLDSILSSVRKALADNGLVMVQSVVFEEIEHGSTTVREELLETRLIHSSGEWFSNTCPVMVSDGENSAQAYGSAITYARRYSITQLLCVVADEDDDGNAAAGNVSQSVRSGGSAGGAAGGAPISDKQLGMLRAKLAKVKGDEVKLCTLLGVVALEALPKGRMDDALKAVDPDSPDPAILRTAGEPSVSVEQRKAAHDKAVAANSESVTYIRKQLGIALKAQVDDSPVELLEAQQKVVTEWRALSMDDQRALWLAPTHGGIFTTTERDALTAACSVVDAQRREGLAASEDAAADRAAADLLGGSGGEA